MTDKTHDRRASVPDAANAPRTRGTSHRWSPISDLTEDERAQADPELRVLWDAWRRENAKLRDSTALRTFNERLARKWSIETGILERIYTLDRGVTQTLVEHGLHATLVPHDATDIPPDRLVQILTDHVAAVEGLFLFVRQERELSTSYVKELHALLTRHQDVTEAVDTQGDRVSVPLLRGDWKKLPNNPGVVGTREIVHEYCPPTQVGSEMERLLALHRSHEGVSPEVESAWLHHRFTQIHPFQDGNGRVARALSTLVLIQAGGFPLVILREQKADYLDALAHADRGDLGPLVGMFSTLQKEALLGGIGLSREIQETERNLDSVVQGAATRLQKAMLQKEETVHEAAKTLVRAAVKKLEPVAARIRDSVRPGYPNARVVVSDDKNSFYYGSEIVEMAERLRYWVNLTSQRYWVRLQIDHDSRAELIFSFHHMGRSETGLMAAVAFIHFRSPPADPRTTPPSFDAGATTRAASAAEIPADVLKPERASEAAFIFSAGREPNEMRTAFDKWMDASILLGLEIWRQRIG